MWNYRVVRSNDYGEEYYEIKEVFYDSSGELMGYSDAVIGSESYDGLFKVSEMIQSAHAKPVIDEKDFFLNKNTICSK